MKKLTIRLVKFERAVAMQVLEQKGFKPEETYKTKPLNISTLGVELWYDDISIRDNRGNEDLSLYVARESKRSNRNRDFYYNKIVASFKDLAKQLNLKFRQDGEYIYLEGQ